jgi:hypothetical protein
MFAVVDLQAVFLTQCLLSLWIILVPISYAISNRLLVISVKRRDKENLARPQLILHFTKILRY